MAFNPNNSPSPSSILASTSNAPDSIETNPCFYVTQWVGMDFGEFEAGGEQFLYVHEGQKLCLHADDGQEHKVTLEKPGNEFVFTKGWKRFKNLYQLSGRLSHLRRMCFDISICHAYEPLPEKVINFTVKVSDNAVTSSYLYLKQIYIDRLMMLGDDIWTLVGPIQRPMHVYFLHQAGKNGRFGEGWKLFREVNGVEEGDELTFTLENLESRTLAVMITKHF